MRRSNNSSLLRRAAVLVTMPLVFRSVVARGQQQQGDSARCATTLNAPRPDSAIVEEDAIFASFDATRDLPKSYADMLGQGLRQLLVLPKPLSIDTYDARAGLAVRDAGSKAYAAVALRSFYRLTLHRDGHLTNARVVGGVRNDAFDHAIVAALTALDTSGMLPPPSAFDTSFAGDTLDLRLTITNGALVSTRFANQSRPSQSGVTPLFLLRVPVLPVDKEIAANGDNPRPRYPQAMRDKGIAGEVRAEFLVRADGTVDPGSTRFLKATSIEFADAIASVLPQMRFFPLEVAGCKVASLTQMPFVFGMNR